MPVAKFDPTSPFQGLTGFRANHCLTRTINLKSGDKNVSARVIYDSENSYRVCLGDKEHTVTGSLVFHPEV